MFRKRCDLFREQNHPLIEQKLPASGSSKSGEEMNCFIGQATGGEGLPTLPNPRIFLTSFIQLSHISISTIKHDSFECETSFIDCVGRGLVYRIKIFRFSNRGIMWLTLPPRVFFILGDGFHACSRKHAPKAGRRTATENHRNCFSTSLASTAFTSHLRQFSAFGICVFSTGRYYRMYSPSLLPISSSTSAYLLLLAS